MPENVTASEVNSTSAMLTWDAPTVQGTFGVSFYRVRLVPSPSDEAIETTMTQILVSGLFPGIEYNVTVTAIVNDTSLLAQEIEVESLSFVFNTSVSGLTMAVTIHLCVGIACYGLHFLHVCILL